jgi:hypothetical protein
MSADDGGARGTSRAESRLVWPSPPSPARRPNALLVAEGMFENFRLALVWPYAARQPDLKPASEVRRTQDKFVARPQPFAGQCRSGR